MASLPQDKEIKLAQSKSLAECNLSMEPKVNDAKNRLQSTYADAIKTKQEVELLKAKLGMAVFYFKSHCKIRFPRTARWTQLARYFKRLHVKLTIKARFVILKFDWVFLGDCWEIHERRFGNWGFCKEIQWKAGSITHAVRYDTVPKICFSKVKSEKLLNTLRDQQYQTAPAPSMSMPAAPMQMPTPYPMGASYPNLAGYRNSYPAQNRF